MNTRTSEALINRSLVGLAILCTLLSGIQYLAVVLYSNKSLGPVIFLLSLGAIFFVFRLKATLTARKYLILAIYYLIATEMLLQLLFLAGVVPKVDIQSHYPYSRVYCKKEGSSNTVMNRYGWHYPDFRLKEDAHRVAVIGDSFVDALQVERDENLGVRLEQLLNQNGKKDWEVIGLGVLGSGPAHYLEFMRYALEHFSPEEVIIMIFLGNDFRNSSARVQTDRSPDDYLYYRLTGDGGIEVYPESLRVQKKLQSSLESNHLPLLISLPKILESHILTLNLFAQINSFMKEPRKELTVRKSTRTAEGALAGELEILGLDSFIFRKHPTPEATEAEAIVSGLLGRCRELATKRGIRLQLVTIPTFPNIFYQQNGQQVWNTEFGDYDLFEPERKVMSIGQAKGIPVLPMGLYMKTHSVAPEKVRSFYFGGRGHLTQAGHDYYAHALYESLPW